MLTPNKCREAWDLILKIYDETISQNNPRNTMDRIIEILGLERTKEVFAVVAAIKKHDGRIYGRNRDFANSIPYNEECTQRIFGNPMIYSGLDHIHTAHINNLITELRKISEELA